MKTELRSINEGWDNLPTGLDVIIVGTHPHSGEKAFYVNREMTSAGIANKFQSYETGIRFFVFNSQHVKLYP